MVTTVHDENTEMVARPAWPQHVRDDRDVADLRDDPSRPYVRSDVDEPVRRGLRARRMVGWIVAAAILAAVAIVATVNRGIDIPIDLAFDEGTLPLWGVIAGAAAMGFAAGRFLDDGC